ncbi:GNAT family N-acetyltransferase [Roseitranquillus sediminis]|uniref:GNAT family N-acetyltransferase n=1 Tax=Roseitranquillus sediminis TaxID=2809051 RepID=UPI001D0CD290|nr:GNAT family N-acetyltransferase [Roseitranquillus sediminis]MBM9595734.1 GNAT family N-acetyltransferase [Roseitranquillus sediminis]
MDSTIEIRPATAADADGIWSILRPVIRAGETYALPRDMTRENALAYWFAPGHAVFVATDANELLGTYYMCANRAGGGAHVANCGYVTAERAQGRGVAAAMCAHSLETARTRGFRAMQFNLVVATNERAVRLWQRMGFAIAGTLPGAFAHPALGDVDAHVMYRRL